MSEPHTSPRCPACGDSNLTPSTYVTPTEGYVRVQFEVRGERPGFLGGLPREHFEVDRATVCLGCGHVSFGLSRATLALLRERVSSLRPYEGP